MDFFLGIIVGVTGYAIANKINEYREQARKPKRGRPPKTNIEVKDEKSE